MNKKDFTEYVNSQLQGKSTSMQLKKLRQIQGNYIPSMINKVLKKENLWVEPGTEKKYFKCEECNKYTVLEKVKSDYVKEVLEEYTYRDAGYGDDDRIGLVEYMVEYKQCPHCMKKQQVSRQYMKIIKDWNAREGRK